MEPRLCGNNGVNGFYSHTRPSGTSDRGVSVGRLGAEYASPYFLYYPLIGACFSRFKGFVSNLRLFSGEPTCSLQEALQEVEYALCTVINSAVALTASPTKLTCSVDRSTSPCSQTRGNADTPRGERTWSPSASSEPALLCSS
eukprot:scaffold13134_cov69-Phaeocystis_antarctica.AAC.3